MRSLAAFLSDDSQSEWVCHGGLTIYVRKTMGDGKFRDRYGDLQIANISAKTPGAGQFTGLLDILIHQGTAVYVENVLTDRFADYLRRKGFVETPNTSPPCFLFVPPA